MTQSTSSSNVQEGMTVHGSDGDSIGTVKQVRANDFLVDRSMKRDIYVPFGAVASSAGDTVTLNVAAGQVGDMNWENPPLFGGPSTTTPPAPGTSAMTTTPLSYPMASTTAPISTYAGATTTMPPGGVGYSAATTTAPYGVNSTLPPDEAGLEGTDVGNIDTTVVGTVPTTLPPGGGYGTGVTSGASTSGLVTSTTYPPTTTGTPGISGSTAGGVGVGTTYNPSVTTTVPPGYSFPSATTTLPDIVVEEIDVIAVGPPTTTLPPATTTHPTV